ncbi:MAG: hypothetical protein H0T62_07540 [Parachlamydiaceae bacterium]|nr:hypothetical protein [Parachlamydiaceae bacterium]
MGSLKFISNSKNECKFSECIAEGEFFDKDNVPVSVTINVDQNGELYELDMWKVDFFPLMQFTYINDVKVLHEENG